MIGECLARARGAPRANGASSWWRFGAIDAVLVPTTVCGPYDPRTHHVANAPRYAGLDSSPFALPVLSLAELRLALVAMECLRRACAHRRGRDAAALGSRSPSDR